MDRQKSKSVRHNKYPAKKVRPPPHPRQAPAPPRTRPSPTHHQDRSRPDHDVSQGLQGRCSCYSAACQRSSDRSLLMHRCVRAVRLRDRARFDRHQSGYQGYSNVEVRVHRLTDVEAVWLDVSGVSCLEHCGNRVRYL